MILLRRGRPAFGTASSLDVEVAIDLGPVLDRTHPGSSAPWRPPIEVVETDAALEIRAEIGGLTTGDTELLVSGDVLSIRGRRDISRRSGHHVYHESRIRHGPFEAAVRLPFPVRVDAATAEYIDGFLTIVLPRQPATTVPTREVPPVQKSQRGDR